MVGKNCWHWGRDWGLGFRVKFRVKGQGQSKQSICSTILIPFLDNWQGRERSRLQDLKQKGGGTRFG